MVTRPRFLERHRQTHLPEEEKPFGCDKCPRRFCWKGALQIHQISHQPADERKLYVCHICGKVYVLFEFNYLTNCLLKIFTL